ncbi:MAG TPA: hypothetical protein VGK73_11250 [Polyangiaceae bacterium]
MSSLWLSGGAARAAEPRDAAAAEVLFEAGKSLLEQGDYAAACPKFEESYRLDPATGALFALALCHERAGKIATAWVEYMEVAGRANSERNEQREQQARERAQALQARLSFLTIRVDPKVAGVPGLAVSHDGVTLRPAAFGAAIPVDPGRHVVRAEAPGRDPWEAVVDVGDTPERKTLDVPDLRAVAPVCPPAKPVPTRTPGTLELTPLRISGIALGGAGVASLIFAGAASWRALSKKASSEGECDTTCTEAGLTDRSAANEAATWATVTAISGAALLGAGALLFVLGKPREKRAGASETTLLLGYGTAEFRQRF